MVGETWLKMLADGAAIGLWAIFIKFKAVLWSGILIPIKLVLAVNSIGIFLDLWKIIVKGPGQKASERTLKIFLYFSVKMTKSSIYDFSHIWTITGSLKGLFLVL